jgi:hypothetical protein
MLAVAVTCIGRLPQLGHCTFRIDFSSQELLGAFQGFLSTATIPANLRWLFMQKTLALLAFALAAIIMVARWAEVRTVHTTMNHSHDRNTVGQAP